MLREDIVEAVAAGRFHIYAVRTVDEALEIVTGVPAGERSSTGAFHEGTVHRRVDDRIKAFAEAANGHEAPAKSRRNGKASHAHGGRHHKPATTAGRRRGSSPPPSSPWQAACAQGSAAGLNRQHVRRDALRRTAARGRLPLTRPGAPRPRGCGPRSSRRPRPAPADAARPVASAGATSPAARLPLLITMTVHSRTSELGAGGTGTNGDGSGRWSWTGAGMIGGAACGSAAGPSGGVRTAARMRAHGGRPVSTARGGGGLPADVPELAHCEETAGEVDLLGRRFSREAGGCREQAVVPAVVVRTCRRCRIMAPGRSPSPAKQATHQWKAASFATSAPARSCSRASGHRRWSGRTAGPA